MPGKNTASAVGAVVHPAPTPVLVLVKGRVTTTSLDLAEKFGKQHKNVLQTIRNLECSERFNRLNFKPVDYRDEKGEQRPMYSITRDGFAFLAMGFTGKESAKWKESYIDAFNRMETKLLHRGAASGPIECIPADPDDPLRAETAEDYLRFLGALDHAVGPTSLLWVLVRAGAHRGERVLSLNEVAKMGSMSRSNINGAAARLVAISVLTVAWGKPGSKTIWRLHVVRLVKYLKARGGTVARLPDAAWQALPDARD